MNNYIKKQTDIAIREALIDITLINDYMVKCINSFNDTMGFKIPTHKEETESGEEKK